MVRMGKVTVIDGNPWKTSLIMSAIIFAVGIAIAIGGKDSLRIILMVSGVFILLGSVVALLGEGGYIAPGTLVMCAAGIILGIALIAVPNFFSDVMMIILAIAVIVMGLIYIMGNLASPAPGARVVGAVLGVLMVIAGVLALFNPSATADVIMTIVGLILAVSGLIGMYYAVSSR